MRLGINISLSGQSSGFGPASLFTAGQPGVWYDPSDITTLFQTNATPVTAAGQSVGVMLDKSQGLTPGPQLVTNGTFEVNTDGWSTVNGAVISAVGGKMQVLNNTAANGNAYQAITTVVGKTYLLTGQISDVTGGISPRIMAGTGISAGDLVSSQYSGSGTFNVRAVFVATGTTTWVNAIMNTTTSGVYASFDDISVQEIPGNHATQTTSGLRPIYQIDGTGRPYLLFDGVDDFLITPTITPGTDKAQVFTGVRKLSDAATGIVVETSTNFNSFSGAVAIQAPNGALARYSFTSRGTAIATAATTNVYAAPITNVLTGIGDIAADTSIIRVNGVQAASVTTDQGTGDYLAYPMYIGRRGGTLLPFNGYLYSLIVRFGSNLDAGTITSTEAWVNTKTGAY